jgi:hypothetical protein
VVVPDYPSTQTVYPAAVRYGGRCAYALSARAHINGTSAYSEEDIRKMFAQWAPYWDRDKHFLVEKSPPNIMKTRFLQAAAGPGRTHFVVTIRHPMAEAYSHGCGKDVEGYLKNWLTQYV